MNNKRWTVNELELVRDNVVPPTRTLAATRCIAKRHRIAFTPRSVAVYYNLYQIWCEQGQVHYV